MTVAQIRKDLKRRRGTLFFSPAERALLAVLELAPYKTLDYARIDADRVNGANEERARINHAIQEAWGDAA